MFVLGRVHKLVEISANLSSVPIQNIPTVRGVDGYMYYQVDIAIEITYYSAYTKYELIHDDVNYGLVTAEYV